MEVDKRPRGHTLKIHKKGAPRLPKVLDPSVKE